MSSNNSQPSQTKTISLDIRGMREQIMDNVRLAFTHAVKGYPEPGDRRRIITEFCLTIMIYSRNQEAPTDVVKYNAEVRYHPTTGNCGQLTIREQVIWPTQGGRWEPFLTSGAATDPEIALRTLLDDSCDAVGVFRERGCFARNREDEFKRCGVEGCLILRRTRCRQGSGPARLSRPVGAELRVPVAGPEYVVVRPDDETLPAPVARALARLRLDDSVQR